MKKISFSFTFIFALIFFKPLLSQDIRYTLGETIQINLKQDFKRIGHSKDFFFILRTEKEKILTTKANGILEGYSRKTMQKMFDVPLVVDMGDAENFQIAKWVCTDDGPYLFYEYYSDKSKIRRLMRAHFDFKGNQPENPEMLYEVTVKDKKMSEGLFSVYYDDNTGFTFVANGITKGGDSYSYEPLLKIKIYNEKMQLFHDGTMQIPELDGLALNEVTISENGNLTMMIRSLKLEGKIMGKSNYSYKDAYFATFGIKEKEAKIYKIPKNYGFGIFGKSFFKNSSGDLLFISSYEDSDIGFATTGMYVARFGSDGSAPQIHVIPFSLNEKGKPSKKVQLTDFDLKKIIIDSENNIVAVLQKYFSGKVKMQNVMRFEDTRIVKIDANYNLISEITLPIKQAFPEYDVEQGGLEFFNKANDLFLVYNESSANFAREDKDLDMVMNGDIRNGRATICYAKYTNGKIVDKKEIIPAAKDDETIMVNMYNFFDLGNNEKVTTAKVKDTFHFIKFYLP